MRYEAGEYYLICDVCGFKVKRRNARKRWDNALVCEKDWEPKNPLLNPVVPRETTAVRDARPEGSDYFLSTNEVSADDL